MKQIRMCQCVLWQGAINYPIQSAHEMEAMRYLWNLCAAFPMIVSSLEKKSRKAILLALKKFSRATLPMVITE